MIRLGNCGSRFSFWIFLILTFAMINYFLFYLIYGNLTIILVGEDYYFGLTNIPKPDRVVISYLIAPIGIYYLVEYYNKYRIYNDLKDAIKQRVKKRIYTKILLKLQEIFHNKILPISLGIMLFLGEIYLSRFLPTAQLGYRGYGLTMYMISAVWCMDELLNLTILAFYVLNIFSITILIILIDIILKNELKVHEKNFLRDIDVYSSKLAILSRSLMKGWLYFGGLMLLSWGLASFFFGLVTIRYYRNILSAEQYFNLQYNAFLLGTLLILSYVFLSAVFYVPYKSLVKKSIRGMEYLSQSMFEQDVIKLYRQVNANKRESEDNEKDDNMDMKVEKEYLLWIAIAYIISSLRKDYFTIMASELSKRYSLFNINEKIKTLFTTLFFSLFEIIYRNINNINIIPMSYQIPIIGITFASLFTIIFDHLKKR